MPAMQLSSISGSWVPRSGGLRVQLSDRGDVAVPRHKLTLVLRAQGTPFPLRFEQQIDVLSCPEKTKKKQDFQFPKAGEK